MQRDDPPAKRFPLHVFEALLRQKVGQLLWRGELEHGGWEVVVRVVVAGEASPDGGEHAQEVEEVEGAEGLPGWRGELEDDESRSGLEDPAKLTDAGAEVGEVADAESDGCAVEGFVGEGQLKCVAGERLDGRTLDLAAAALEHGDGEIGREDVSVEGRSSSELEREIESTAAGVEEEAGVRPPVEELVDGASSPALIDV